MCSRLIKQLFPCNILLIFCAGTIFSDNNFLNRLHIDLGSSFYRIQNEYLGQSTIIAGGFQCDFPVGPDRLSLRFGADIGTLPKTRRSDATGILFSNISLIYSIPLIQRTITIEPSLSLLNCALHAHPSGSAEDLIIIATWENEFGAGAAINCTYLFKRVTISIPFSIGVIFTSSPTFLISSGLRLGMNLDFPQGKRAP